MTHPIDKLKEALASTGVVHKPWRTSYQELREAVEAVIADLAETAESAEVFRCKIELLKCNVCGKYALGFADDTGGHRITSHKCAGAWSIVELFRCQFTGATLREFSELPAPKQSRGGIDGDT